MIVSYSLHENRFNSANNTRLLLMREVAWHRHDGGRDILPHTKKSPTITASDQIFRYYFAYAPFDR